MAPTAWHKYDKPSWICRNPECTQKGSTYGFKMQCRWCGGHKGQWRLRDELPPPGGKRTLAAEQLQAARKQREMLEIAAM